MARIILADDSKLMRGILRGVLEGAGHEIDEWMELSALEVPDRLQAAAADLLISDFQMPGCNGLTLARLAQTAKPDLPVIILTSSHDPAVLSALQKLNVRIILHKPIRGQDLLEAVQTLLPAREG